jgi:hypothetical protein
MADDLAVIRVTISDADLTTAATPTRTIRLPKGLKLSIAIAAALDLIGKGLKDDVTAALKAQGFK